MYEATKAMAVPGSAVEEEVPHEREANDPR